MGWAWGLTVGARAGQGPPPGWGGPGPGPGGGGGGQAGQGQESRAGDTPDVGPCPAGHLLGLSGRRINGRWLLAVTQPPQGRSAAQACSRAWAYWLFGGQRICNPQAFSQRLGPGLSVAGALASDLGLGRASLICHRPGPGHKVKLAAASGQPVRAGDLARLGHKE